MFEQIAPFSLISLKTTTTKEHLEKLDLTVTNDIFQNLGYSKTEGLLDI